MSEPEYDFEVIGISADDWQPAPNPGAWLAEHPSGASLDARVWEFLCAYSGALSDDELADELEDDMDPGDPFMSRAVEMLRTQWRPA